MTRMTATGDYTVIASGFIAEGDSNQSDGIGAHYEIARFTDVHEAVEATRGKGVQGDYGYVSKFETRLYEGGLVSDRRRNVYKRRECWIDSWMWPGEKSKAYHVGWVNPDGTAADEYVDPRLEDLK